MKNAVNNTANPNHREFMAPATQNASVTDPSTCRKCPHHEKGTQHIHNLTNPLPLPRKNHPSQRNANKIMRLPREARSRVTFPTHFLQTAQPNGINGVEHATHRRRTQLNPQTPTHKREPFATHSEKRSDVFL